MNFAKACSVALLGSFGIASAVMIKAEPQPASENRKSAEEETAQGRTTGARKYSNAVLKKQKRNYPTIVIKKDIDVGTPLQEPTPRRSSRTKYSNVVLKKGSDGKSLKAAQATTPVRATTNLKLQEANRLSTPPPEDTNKKSTSSSKKSKPMILKSKKILEN